MTKSEASEAMKTGAKVTHRYFDPKEWITMNDNLSIVTEEGVTSSTTEFWGWRKSHVWETDWSIWSNP